MEEFSTNELLAFILSEIVKLRAHSKLVSDFLREKGLLSEYESRYQESLKTTVDEIIKDFPFLELFLKELKRIMSKSTEKEAEPKEESEQVEEEIEKD